MRKIDQVIVHCSATKPFMDIDVATIRKWHLDRGFSDIGYHYVIRRSGETEVGRPVDKMGAHAIGYNASSIGVCLVGGINPEGGPDANFTMNQYATLKVLLSVLKREHNLQDRNVIGHRDVSTKACPCFDIQGFLQHA